MISKLHFFAVFMIGASMCLNISCTVSAGRNAEPERTGNRQNQVDYSEHKAELLQKLESNPDDAQAYIFLGLISFKEEQFEEAKKYFLEGLSLAATEDEKRAYMIVIDSNGSQFISEEEQSFFQKAHDLIEQRRPEEAIVAAQSAIDINPNNAMLYYEIGYAYIELRNFERAVFFLEKGNVLNPVHGNIYQELKYCYTELGMLDKSLALVEQYLIVFDSNPHVFSELAYSYMKAEKYEEALDILKHIMEEFPEYPITYLYFGQLYGEQLNDTDRAIENLNHFLALIEGKTEISGEGYSFSAEDTNATRMEARKLLEKYNP